MKITSAIGAVYLGIYLILPGCMCQLLEAFGFQVHERSRPTSVRVVSNDSGVIVCHCDHCKIKTAEISPTQSSTPEVYPLISRLDSCGPPVPHLAQVGSSFLARGPPDSALLPIHRTFSGVYLI